MTNPWDRAEEALVALEHRTQYDERNRLALLSVHGLKGVGVGVLLYLFGPPEAWVMLYGHETEVFLLLPAMAGGIMLLLGLLLNRNILLEALGMIGLLIWDLLMIWTLSMAGLNPYAVAVYVGMAGLMGIHLMTLVRYLRGRLKEPDDA